MKKTKLVLLFTAVCLVLNSCAIFHKGCGCPHFGVIKHQPISRSAIA